MTGGNAMDDASHNGPLSLTAGPHIRSGESISKIMWSAVGSLLPAAAFAVYLFGFAALVLISVSVVTAVCADALAGYALRRRVTVHDGSAVVTGLLLAMTLPPLASWWMAVVGSSAAIVLAKQIFGGLGRNIFNPALAGRAFLAVAWPGQMSLWWFGPGGSALAAPESARYSGPAMTAYDALTRAAPMAPVGNIQVVSAAAAYPHDPVLAPAALKSLLIGNAGGCIGEASVLLLLAGALFLFARKIITWRIPAACIGAAAACFAALNIITGVPNPLLTALFNILSGGMVLGAFFMATDTVTSPVTGWGMLLFGAGCGFIAFLMRAVLGRADGVCFSILIMNALVPLIDRFLRPRVYGSRWKSEGAGAGP